MPERISDQGSVILTKGLYGGYLDKVPTGIKPREHENPASSEGRQRFFYSAIKELSKSDWIFAKFWQPGGPMDTIGSEFSFALDEARRLGTIDEPTERKLKSDYEKRTIACICMEGMVSLVKNSDGALVNIVDKMPMPEVMDKYGWDDKKSALISGDPAVAWPLTWIRKHAESGALLRHFYNGTTEEYKQILIQAMEKDVKWDTYRKKYGIADGVEDSVVNIAFDYWQLEDLPDFHRRLAAKEIILTDNVLVKKDGKDLLIKNVVEPMKPKMGVLPYDDIYYSNIDRPVDVIRNVKKVYARDPEILDLLHGFLTYNDRQFPIDPENPNKNQGLQGRIPSELSVKDIDKWVKMQDALIGGPQAKMLADFSKFSEGLDALCNLYAGIPERGDVLGWMVGEIFYVKVRALMINSDREGFSDQVFKMLNLGDEDTPKEIDAAYKGMLGTTGTGTFGAIARAVAGFELNIGSKHYHDALAMLRTGVKNPIIARMAQPVLAALSTVNRLTMSGKKR